MPVSSAIDGKTEADQSGWGIGGSPPGVLRHTAAFKLEKPIANSDTNGTALRFILRQTYAPEFQIGRFRLYVTSSEEPLDFGMPEPVVDALKASAGQRTPEQTTALVEYHRHTDVEFWLRKLAAADAAKPLPADSKLKELEKAVADAKLPIRLNPHLVQLRQDAKASGQQIENPRLTVVQDLAWALINSPGFLFNH